MRHHENGPRVLTLLQSSGLRPSGGAIPLLTALCAGAALLVACDGGSNKASDDAPESPAKRDSNTGDTDDEGSGDSPTTDSTETSGTDTNDATTSSGGDGAWSQAIVRDAVSFACGDAESTVKGKGAPGIVKGTASLYIGYRQVSSTNKDPIVLRFDGGAKTWCATDLETTGDDQTGYGLAWDGGSDFYAVFTTTGTQGDASQDFRRFATGGWLSSYGSGGGAKAAVLVRAKAADGKPDAATFLKAQKSDGKTNSLLVTALTPGADAIEVKYESYFSPLKADKKPFDCTGGSSPFPSTLTLSRDLKSATAATAPSPCK